VKRALNPETSNPAKPIKSCNTRDLDSPQPKAVFAEMLLDVIDHRIALNAIEPTPEEFHHS
jgi:hypothetical protein